MRKPMIALPADTYTEATSIINLRNAAFAPDPAIKAITKSGGLPIVLPTVAAENAASYVDLFDGLLLLGGFDVDPTFYGQEPHFELGETFRKRDLFEIALLKATIEAGKPIMGICRGLQLINAGLGGTLYQDLSEDPTVRLKHHQLAQETSPPTTLMSTRAPSFKNWLVIESTSTLATTSQFMRWRRDSKSLPALTTG